MKDYHEIKDNCRTGLLKYLAEAFTLVPKIIDPVILDIGCGTGVPTIWVAENYGGQITAVDTDHAALEWLRAKIIAKKLENQITTVNQSFFDLAKEASRFDIVIAEGFLNVIGFEKGFPEVIRMINKGGYFVIHDEYKDHEMKCDFIRKNHCELAGTVFLDERVWWNDYYSHLEAAINSVEIRQRGELFRSDLKEIEYYWLDATPFRSIYYIVKRK